MTGLGREAGQRRPWPWRHSRHGGSAVGSPRGSQSGRRNRSRSRWSWSRPWCGWVPGAARTRCKIPPRALAPPDPGENHWLWRSGRCVQMSCRSIARPAGASRSASGPYMSRVSGLHASPPFPRTVREPPATRCRTASIRYGSLDMVSRCASPAAVSPGRRYRYSMTVTPDSALTGIRLTRHHRTTRTRAGLSAGAKLIRRARGNRRNTWTTKNSRVAELAARTEAEDMAPNLGSAADAITKSMGATRNSPKKDETRAQVASTRKFLPDMPACDMISSTWPGLIRSTSSPRVAGTGPGTGFGHATDFGRPRYLAGNIAIPVPCDGHGPCCHPEPPKLATIRGLPTISARAVRGKCRLHKGFRPIAASGAHLNPYLPATGRGDRAAGAIA